MPLASIADLNRPLEEISPYIDQAKELSALYDDFIILEQDGHDRLPGIHASELYPCLRKPVYSLMGTPRKPNVSKFWKQRFKMGTAIHQFLQADFHALAKRSQKGLAMRTATAVAEKMDCYVEFEDELKVAPDLQPIAAYYKLQSHADGVFTFKKKEDDEVALRVGLEIKSEAPDGYSKLTEPKAEHVRQGHIYMACLDLPLMWFLYVNKGNQNNTSSSAPWLVTWQPRIWEELQDRFKVIHEHAAKNELPERTETIMCEFCPWAYTCQPQNIMKSFQKANNNRRETIRKPGA